MSQENRKQLIIYCSLLMLISVVQYSLSFGNDFVWDSKLVFLDDPTIRDVKYFPDYWLESFMENVHVDRQVEQLPYYRPLTKTIHLVEHYLFGMTPVWYNSVSILLNAFIVALGFLVVSEITGSRNVGFLAAVLYAVNPSRVEAVSWAYSDSYLFAAFFSFLSLYLYAGERRLLSLIPFVLSLFCHESAILLVLILPLFDFLIRNERAIPLVRHLAPFGLAAFLFLLLRKWAVGSVPVADLPVITYLNTITVIIQRYVKIFFVPDALIAVYPSELFPGFTPEVIWSYAVMLFLSVTAVALSFLSRQLLFWYLWFFIWIAISFNAGAMGEFLMADKLLNMASFGFCTAIALLVINADRWKKTAILCAVLLIVAHTSITFARTRYWKDNVSYLEKALEFKPDFFIANYTLGQEYSYLKDYDKAIIRFEKAVAAIPAFSPAHNSLGNCYCMIGQLSKAVGSWEKAALSDPENPLPYYNIGMVMEKKGELDLALHYYKRYLALIPKPPQEALLRIVQLEHKMRSRSR